MRSLVFDLRDAFRSLRRERAYAATVILTLALALGATTAVFSIVNGGSDRREDTPRPAVAPGGYRGGPAHRVLE